MYIFIINNSLELSYRLKMLNFNFLNFLNFLNYLNFLNFTRELRSVRSGCCNLDPLGRSYEFSVVIPSVSSSVRPSVFLRIGSSFFSDFFHEVRGPLRLKSDRARFFGKTIIFQKMGGKGPKRPKKAQK